MKIGNLKIEGIASLAPMAGITDKAFRQICRNFGAAYLTSEMVSVKGIIYNSEKTFSLMEHSEEEKPFALQLFGSDPEDFFKAVNLISNYLPDIIDINMGCPATKIVKENSGSSLMRNPEICAKIVKSVKSACNIPVTIKIRSGWDSSSINATEVAQACCEAGVDAITVHGRTKHQGYSGKVDLDVIKMVKKISSVPVIGNGDIVSVESAKKMLEYTGCDFLAIGRGAIGNPWIFSEINNWYFNNKESEKVSIQEKVRVMKLHIEKMCLFKGEYLGVRESRKHLSSYIKGIPRAADYRNLVFSSKTKKELLDICDSILLSNE